MYEDERGWIITEEELKASFEELRANGETDCETFSQYVRECCGKNGTITRKEQTMPKQFSIGNEYFPNDDGFPPITILKRTEKSISAFNGTSKWMMRIRIDEHGNEYATDSSVPRNWRECFTYYAQKKGEKYEKASA